jgi:hypothetical protein
MLACKRSGQYFVITNTREALDLLFGGWPVHDGKAYIVALAACAAALDGAGNDDDARAALIAAAREAEVPISPGMTFTDLSYVI